MMQKRSACVRGEKCLPLTHKARLNCALYHHPTLAPEEIADLAEIGFARLKAYACESHPNDLIPFKPLVRFCAVTGRWDVIDAELNQHQRGVEEFSAKSNTDTLNEAIDVLTMAAKLLEDVRVLSQDGKMDAADRAKVRERLRAVRSELEQVDASLDTPAQSPSLRAGGGVVRFSEPGTR